MELTENHNNQFFILKKVESPAVINPTEERLIKL